MRSFLLTVLVVSALSSSALGAEKKYTIHRPGQPAQEASKPLKPAKDDVVIPSLGMRIQRAEGGKAPLTAMTEKCAQGSKEICYALSRYYLDARFEAKAGLYRARACELGHQMACRELEIAKSSE
ncbi:MAG: hypothetical protein IT285_07955 [Bdellovibrionales bacterium]|nr:hypothetical protein [Bdellovibrionales bacterium]